MADVTPPDDAPRPQPAEPEPLWREVLGQRLRELRTDRDQTLIETARRAGISPQYLSEMERGRKEPSSEMIAAVAGALGAGLLDITSDVVRHLERRASTPSAQRRVMLALAA